MSDTFRAVYYEEYGPAASVLNFAVFQAQPPAPDEVTVRIYASGVNPSDVKIRSGQRRLPRYEQLIPHSDGAGVVVAIGANVNNFKEGDRVWVFNAAWHRPYGTAAELCTLPTSLVVPLPDHISYAEGACLGIPALTAACDLLALNCSFPSTIVVTGGAGSVGHMVIQLAKFLGHRVITTVSSQNKAEIAHQAGADLIINYKQESVSDRITEFTLGGGVDGIIDVDFGTNLSWTPKVLKENTAIVAYASMGTPFPVLPFYEFMHKNIRIIPQSVYIIPDSLRSQTITLVQEALLKKELAPLIGATYEMTDIVKAHEAVETGQKIGQVVVKVQ